ncbi:sporulation initiation phosphotransferase F [archaeon BMS3Abin17]|nr:sporulation initiation phosphotransferase F [archaeon BMS3Abin17]HDZ60583.1 response regulator [Candidatus Pacearchaeota archaeon]
MTNKKKILFADDNQGIRKAASFIFPRENTEFYEDGISLDKKLKQSFSNPPDLVITDHEMPGINGGEIIKEYARREEFENTFFILAYGGAEEIGKRAREDGAAAYIRKPYGPVDLKNLIDKLVKS